MASSKSKTDTDWTDEQAQARFVWLTQQAGQELVDFGGGAVHAPRYSGAAVEQLERIAEVAGALADRYRGEPEASVEDAAVTPREQLPEAAQEDLKAGEKAQKADAKK